MCSEGQEVVGLGEPFPYQANIPLQSTPHYPPSLPRFQHKRPTLCLLQYDPTLDTAGAGRLYNTINN